MKVVETYLYKWLGRTWKPKYPEAWGLYEGANKICEICEQPISDDKLYCRWGLVVVNGFRKPHLFCGHRECLRKKKKRGGAKMGKAICKVCGMVFKDDEYFTGERKLRFHVADQIRGDDLAHIFAYPDVCPDVRRSILPLPQEYQKVSIPLDTAPWNWDREYFYQARLSSDRPRVLYVIFKHEKMKYMREYRVHLLVATEDKETLEKIAKMAEYKFYRTPAAFWVTKINDKYAIISKNHDSDIDRFCQESWGKMR